MVRPRDSNPRPPAPKADALPTELSRRYNQVPYGLAHVNKNKLNGRSRGGSRISCQGTNFSCILTKCELKKRLARWYFLHLHFLASGNLGLLSVVLILDIKLLSSFLKCLSLTLNVFGFIHRKTLSMAEVYIGYNLNAQTHTINSPAWSGLSQ